MTLDELFVLAGDGEGKAMTALAAHPELAVAVAVAGDYQGGQAAPAIVHAAARGMSELVGTMLDLGADAAARGLGGGTALHIAAWMGHADTVRLLIARGAPLDLRCEAFGATALGWAAHGFGPEGCFPKGDHARVVELLLAAGANPRLANADGNRPVDLVREPAGNSVFRALATADAAM